MTIFKKNERTMPVNKMKLNNSPLRRSDFFDVFDDFFNTNWPSMHLDSSLEKFTPAINVKEDDQNYIVEAELPGIDKEAIDISVKNGNLFLKGEKRTFNEEKKEDYHHIERSYGTFYRAIPLSKDADIEKVNANFQNGLLTILVGKKDATMSNHRKINIG